MRIELALLSSLSRKFHNTSNICLTAGSPVIPGTWWRPAPWQGGQARGPAPALPCHRCNDYLPRERKNFRAQLWRQSSHRGECGQDEGLAIIKVPRSMKPPSNESRSGLVSNIVRQGMKKGTRTATGYYARFCCTSSLYSCSYESFIFVNICI